MNRATRLFRIASPSIRNRNASMIQAMEHADIMRAKADSYQQIIAALIYAYGDDTGRVYIKREHQMGLSRTQSLSMVQHNEDGAFSIEILDSRIVDAPAETPAIAVDPPAASATVPAGAPTETPEP